MGADLTAQVGTHEGRLDGLDKRVAQVEERQAATDARIDRFMLLIIGTLVTSLATLATLLLRSAH